MDDKDFTLLKTLYEEKNITHTAKRMFISQPAISDRLKHLEAEFGCQLFVRQPRGIQFTPQGEVLMRYINKAAEGYNKVKNIISSPVGETFGTLSICCSTFFARYELPAILSGFKKAYPGVEVKVKSGIGPTYYRDFLKRKSDLCILHFDHDWPEQKQKIHSDPLCIFSREPVSLEQLPALPYIRCTSGFTLPSLVRDWWYASYKKPPTIPVETDSMDAALSLAEHGLGFTILPECCRQNAASMDLNVIRITNKKGEPVLYDTWMYYRNTYQLMTGARLFIEYIDDSKVNQ